MNTQLLVVGAVFFLAELKESTQSKMASTQPLKAFVLGGTGTLGKAIVAALLDVPEFEKVTVIGRRTLELPHLAERPEFSKIDQKLIDFEDLSKYAETFQGYDVGFCALGISSVGITNEQYFRITHDYVMDTAKLAKDGGCRHFHFVSGKSTSKTSMYYWARTKAQVEEELTAMGWERLSIYRPAGIVKDPKTTTTKLESVGVCAFKILDPFKLISLDALDYAKGIVRNELKPIPPSGVETLEHSAIKALSKEASS